MHYIMEIKILKYERMLAWCFQSSCEQSNHVFIILLINQILADRYLLVLTPFFCLDFAVHFLFVSFLISTLIKSFKGNKKNVPRRFKQNQRDSSSYSPRR